MNCFAIFSNCKYFYIKASLNQILQSQKMKSLIRIEHQVKTVSQVSSNIFYKNENMFNGSQTVFITVWITYSSD